MARGRLRIRDIGAYAISYRRKARCGGYECHDPSMLQGGCGETTPFPSGARRLVDQYGSTQFVTRWALDPAASNLAYWLSVKIDCLSLRLTKSWLDIPFVKARPIDCLPLNSCCIRLPPMANLFHLRCLLGASVVGLSTNRTCASLLSLLHILGYPCSWMRLPPPCLSHRLASFSMYWVSILDTEDH